MDYVQIRDAANHSRKRQDDEQKQSEEGPKHEQNQREGIDASGRCILEDHNSPQ